MSHLKFQCIITKLGEVQYVKNVKNWEWGSGAAEDVQKRGVRKLHSGTVQRNIPLYQGTRQTHFKLSEEGFAVPYEARMSFVPL